MKKLANIAILTLLLVITTGYLTRAKAMVASPGQTLSIIAQSEGCGSDYMKLAKANNIINPDVIYVGQSINTAVCKNQTQSIPVKSSVATNNAYAYGWCTHYVKTRRPDIGNYWGDAYQWLNSARNAGYATGYTPRVGAIAWNGINQYSPLGHVAYVESISGNMVTVSEMAAPVWGVKSYRTVPASNFMYIY